MLLLFIAALLLYFTGDGAPPRVAAPSPTPEVTPSELPAAGAYDPEFTPGGEQPDPVSGQIFSADCSGYRLLVSVVTDDDFSVETSAPDVKEYAGLSYRYYDFALRLKGEPAGKLRLTLAGDGSSGTLWFLESSATLPVELTVAREGGVDAPDVHRMTYSADGIEVTSAPSGTFGTGDSIYVETDGVYVKAGRVIGLVDLGSTVHRVADVSASVSFRADDGGFVLTQRLEAPEGGFSATHGACCTSPLVDWSVDYKGAKVRNLDASTACYTILDDGFYYEKPADYSPYENDSENRYVYKSAFSSLHRSLLEANCGSFVRLMGLHLLYTRIESFNDEGYIPNPCTSLWLLADYGIGAGFYDTRFNIDAIRTLLFAEVSCDDPLIRSTVERAIGYFLDVRQEYGFTAAGELWTPDYLSADGQVSSTHASLNHALAEGLTLIEAGLTCSRQDFIDAGLEIYGAIERTGEMWIRDTGDLWYGISNTGEMVRDDYVSVTYNDLVATVQQLSQMGLLESYPHIRSLLASKEEWLRENGGAHHIVTHP